MAVVVCKLYALCMGVDVEFSQHTFQDTLTASPNIIVCLDPLKNTIIMRLVKNKLRGGLEVVQLRQISMFNVQYPEKELVSYLMCSTSARSLSCASKTKYSLLVRYCQLSQFHQFQMLASIVLLCSTCCLAQKLQSLLYNECLRLLLMILPSTVSRYQT